MAQSVAILSREWESEMNQMNFAFPISCVPPVNWSQLRRDHPPEGSDSPNTSSSSSPLATRQSANEWQKFIDQGWKDQLIALQMNMVKPKLNDKESEVKKRVRSEKQRNGVNTTSQSSPSVYTPPFLPFNHNIPVETDKEIRLRTQNSRRRQRVLFTPEQIQTLEERFENTKYLTPNERDRLAEKLGLTSTQIKIWFQNRRYKRRRIDQDLALQSVGLGLGVPLGESIAMSQPSFHEFMFGPHTT
ncbi:unnamed protein product [Bursaphelenchus okinawaensis]|uniref:Homeobox domain-containing protein n=1 Tax=Bursaphelenchus okinawaensis TaxID=465554 RepID=A0A811KKP6_9BILA|nr:unnamed protein product [Bursaphelenchus okinawaensis]CAG9105227.1 unnamed protein product [Bursaphelenchus okinawaensis]